MRIDINLATEPYQDLRQLWMRWGGVLAALGLFSLFLVFNALSGIAAARKDRELIRQRQEQIAARDNERTKAEATLNLPENRSTRDRSQFLNDLFQRKAFSWTKVFEDLERVMPAQLHVVSIQPDMSDNHQLEIKLKVAGGSRDRALELVRRMETSQRFQQTRIDLENSQFGQTPEDSVQFDISAVYAPEAESAGKRSTP